MIDWVFFLFLGLALFALGFVFGGQASRVCHTAAAIAFAVGGVMALVA
jgi:hypothetical protein